MNKHNLQVGEKVRKRCKCKVCNKILSTQNTTGYCSTHVCLLRIDPQGRWSFYRKANCLKCKKPMFRGAKTYKCRACRVNSTVISCDWCSKEFKRNINEIRKNENHFCSRKCTGEYTKKYKFGSRSNRFGTGKLNDKQLGHRMRVRYLLNKAIQKGIVERKPCIICGEKGHAHHPNYKLPFVVVFLCRKHHARLHANGWHKIRSEEKLKGLFISEALAKAEEIKKVLMK